MIPLVAPKPPVQQPRPNRMTLGSVTAGIVEAPFRIVLHGKDGVGKSTFAAGAPSPIFLGVEDGTTHLDVARFPMPICWEDVLDAVATLTADPGPYKTFVIDTLDWTEPLVWRLVCKEAGVNTIEEVGGGWAKGYTAAIDHWRILLAALERLQLERKMNVILVAHSVIKKFANPEGEDYERWVLAMNERAAAVIRQWAKAVYFASLETFALKKKGERPKGVTTGARLFWTQPAAAYDAKDRYSLPESIPLDWAEFETAVRAGSPSDPVALRAEIGRKVTLIGGEIETKAREFLSKNGSPSALVKLNDRLNAKLAEKREQEGAEQK